MMIPAMWFPRLAGSWTISPDQQVYTFTLRSDSVWSDGRPITADDVRYGILRTLTSDTGSGYAFVLQMIKNAAGFSSGSITDPAQVGVEALDDTHLKITLERPDPTLLTILSLWVARPMPKWAIETWGEAWTEPSHIVTSGAHRLSEWGA